MSDSGEDEGELGGVAMGESWDMRSWSSLSLGWVAEERVVTGKPLLLIEEIGFPLAREGEREKVGMAGPLRVEFEELSEPLSGERERALES
jgi:hypothetical protein